ncbi:MAG: DISARM system phospholipase D-like protein DrmC [Gammaproteobacteria bacterium]
MQALLDAVVELVTLVSPAKARTIAGALSGLSKAADAPSAKALADTPAARAAVSRILAEWLKTQVSGAEVAGMLMGASEARRSVELKQSVELVWTGPTTRFVPTRRTEQVLLDLIKAARANLFLVSFVAYDIPSIVAALNSAAGRGVRVRILVEASIIHGGSLSVDPAATMRTSVPTADIFTWKNRSDPFEGGRVHAKVAVIDRKEAFITSANLTGHALEKNMEAGVLVRGGSLPSALQDHLDALIDVGVVARV